VAAELERRRIATVAIQLLEEIAVRVRPPRSLLVPFPLGYPLGRPGDPAIQREVLEAALAMLADRALSPPALARFG
jgi:hypothetical protein